MNKKYMKNSFSGGLGLIGGGVALGLGTQVLSSVPNTGGAQTALGSLSGALPTVGKVMAGGMVLDALDQFHKKTRGFMR